MNLQTVLFRIKDISDDICNNKLQRFSETLDEITITRTSLSKQHFGDHPRGHLKNLYNNIQPSFEIKANNAQKLIDRHFQVLNNKRNELKRVKSILEERETEYKTKKKNLQNLERQCEKKLKAERNLKDCIKTYKLLTQTHFAYKKGVTTGYIRPKNLIDFEVFNYNHSEMSEEEIRKKLWSLLRDVTKQDEQFNKKINNSEKLILS